MSHVALYDVSDTPSYYRNKGTPWVIPGGISIESGSVVSSSGAAGVPSLGVSAGVPVVPSVGVSVVASRLSLTESAETVSCSSSAK